MTRGGKIALWVVGSIVAFFIFLQVGADAVATHIMDKQIRKAITKANLPYIIDYGRCYCFLSTGTAMFWDIHFVNDTVVPDGTKEAVELKINSVEVQIDYYLKIYRQKHIGVHKLTVNEPQVAVWTTKKPKERHDHVQQKVQETIHTVSDSIVVAHNEEANRAKKWIHQAGLTKVVIKDASLTWNELGSHMSMSATDVDAEVNSFVYDLYRDTITYCDSMYMLHVGHWKMLSPDGLFQVEANNIETQDGGVIRLGTTHLGHSVPKKQLARIMKEPTDWIDMYINQVEISETNLMRENWKDGVHIPYIMVDVERFENMRDERYEPKRPYKMPQVVLMKMGYPIHLDQIDVKIHTLDVGVLKTNQNYGKMQLNHVNASICNFTNRRGGTIEAQMNAILGKGSMSGAFRMRLNRACQWEMALSAREVDLDFLNPLIRPLVAIEVNCHVDSLRTVYKGNKTSANGTFMLGYTGISAKVYKDLPIPYKMISQNAGAIEYFVNNLIPKSNPKYAGKPATVYSVEWEWKPEKEAVPFYLVAPVIMGAVETYLPGLFVGKKIKPSLPVKK